MYISKLPCQFDQDVGFSGTFYAPNITPYKLGKWTDGEIIRAIMTGVNKQGKALFPVMAYHRLGLMDQADIYSIIVNLTPIHLVKKMFLNQKPTFLSIS